LNRSRLDGQLVADTLNLVLKTRADQQLFAAEIGPEGVERVIQQPEKGGETCQCR
jgi:hypothetical protein